MSLQPLLDYVNRLVPLTEAEGNLFLSKFRPRKYLKGQYVVQQGDVCIHESFVLSGCLKTFHVDPGGQEHVVMFAVENWWTSDLGSFLSQTPADYNVQCLENTELALISYPDLEALYAQLPQAERFFRIILQKALVAAQKRIVQNFPCRPGSGTWLLKSSTPTSNSGFPSTWLPLTWALRPNSSARSAAR
jgi:CRP-like cAMP-binding protein